VGVEPRNRREIFPLTVGVEPTHRPDGRKLWRYRKRWKVERLFAWLSNFRRLMVRYEGREENYLEFVLLGCMVILLRHS
jgi:transposase